MSIDERSAIQVGALLLDTAIAPIALKRKQPTGYAGGLFDGY